MTGHSEGGVGVSVCMATHNGENYVVEQLRSILDQLADNDEVVIVDDGSTDGTVAAVASLGDRRVRMHHRANNVGYVKTFEEALTRSRGRWLFLADQDDVWVAGRLQAMLTALEDHDVVASNLVFLNDGGKPSWWMTRRQQAHWRRNVVRVLADKSGYYGCGMAFRRTFLPVALPFPDYLVESHDLWLGLAGNLAHSMAHIESPTIQRRVHGGNVTPDRPRNVRTILRARLMLLRAIVELRRRLARTSRHASGREPEKPHS